LVDTKTFSVAKASQTITVTTHAPASAVYNTTSGMRTVYVAAGSRPRHRHCRTLW
jgi:hypothetical protein